MLAVLPIFFVAFPVCAKLQINIAPERNLSSTVCRTLLPDYHHDFPKEIPCPVGGG
jgi:hypothetical protein